MHYRYNISGMKCNSCVASIKEKLLQLKDVNEAFVQIASPQAIIRSSAEVPLTLLQSALEQVGDYTIIKASQDSYLTSRKVHFIKWIKTYKPVLIIVAYLFAITVLIEINKTDCRLENWMSNFMSGFFLVFSFFKMLDLKGFASTYSTYDIVAKRWYSWGYIYVFIELGIGIAYLLKSHLLIIDSITLLIMLLSLWGVVQTILDKKQIKCACLGTVFNLPMGTLTIIENVLMIGMSIIMITLRILKSG
jgi:cation transport ATPase